MLERIRAIWQRLGGSLWLLPTVVALCAIALAVVMVELSTIVDSAMLTRYPRVFGADPDSARSALAAIAGSIITVAGVTFSITVLVLSQASSQYTPRVLRSFMRDHPSQLSLGVLVGVFLYCLVLIRTIRGNGLTDAVPALAVVVAYGLAVVAIAVLIYFIHHIAATLDAGSVVARISTETIEAIERLCPAADSVSRAAEDGGIEGRAPCASERSSVKAPGTGYLQVLDTGRLLKQAQRAGVTFRFEREIGAFVLAGTPLVWVCGEENARVDRAAVAGAITIDTYRILFQDPAYGVRQVADIALKALSPAMNDTTTAVLCLDYLEAILRCLAPRRIIRALNDSEGVVRLVIPRSSFRSIVDVALNEIRIAAAANPRVLRRMLDLLNDVGSCVHSAERRSALLAHVGHIRSAIDASVRFEDDRRALRQLCCSVHRALSSAPAGALTD